MSALLGADPAWHVCCRPCRAGDHATAGCSHTPLEGCNCTRCEDRERETFADPHPDDWRATC